MFPGERNIPLRQIVIVIVVVPSIGGGTFQEISAMREFSTGVVPYPQGRHFQ